MGGLCCFFCVVYSLFNVAVYMVGSFVEKEWEMR